MSQRRIDALPFIVQTSLIMLLMLSSNAAHAGDNYTHLTSYDASQNGINVHSSTEYDPQSGWRFFYYTVNNASGDTLYELTFPGQGLVGGAGEKNWQNEITDVSIRFYDNLLLDGTQEEFLTGSECTATWKIKQAEFKSDAGGTFHIDVLVPEYSTSDFNQDNDVDLADFAIFAEAFNGPNRMPANADYAPDLDVDGDVDLADFAQFASSFNGPNRAPRID